MPSEPLYQPTTPLLEHHEVIGEHLPYDGRHRDCPHSVDWQREHRAPQTMLTEHHIFDIRYIQCTFCRYEQTLRRPRPTKEEHHARRQ